MNTFPAPDTKQAVSFIALMFHERPITLVAITTEGKVKAKTFRANDAPSIERWVERWQGKGNIYFQVNELREGFIDKKAKKEDVVLARYLHVDIDDKNALDRIVAFAPPPTAIVFSGGGFQLFYKLREPTPDLDRVEWANAWLGKQLGGDNTHNIDRIMRLPGTINLPHAKKAAAGRVPALAYVLDAKWARAYSLDDFGSLPPNTPAGASAGEVHPVDCPDDLPAELKVIIELGDDPVRPRGSEQPRFKSRSEAVFFAACQLVNLEIADEVIAGILLNSKYRISDSILERKTGRVAYALRQAQNARAAVGAGWPDTDKNGRPRSTYRNTTVALRRLNVAFAYDLFRHRCVVHGHHVEHFEGGANDKIYPLLREAVIRKFNFDPHLQNVVDAVDFLCLENTFHPVLDMLDSLKHDGVPRIDGWLTTYLGADDTPLNRAIGTIFLVAAVRRVRQPGVKFDQIVVFEGAQGSGKSTALQILAGDGLHSDQEILGADGKAQMELMEGKWIYELGELVGLNKAEVNRIKAFASRTYDTARMAYGRAATTRGRQTVFVGTTNEDRYLRDTTGNRRFWPVKTGVIDLERLRQDRDQLWAEASALEATGFSLTLPAELWTAASDVQNERMEDDLWIDALAALVGTVQGGMERIPTSDVLVELQIPRERWRGEIPKRLAAVMAKLGWHPSKFWLFGKVLRGYERPASQRDPDRPTIDGKPRRPT
jgi:energy-coupling factor transporter ATP-binding protein EcfA2